MTKQHHAKPHAHDDDAEDQAKSKTQSHQPPKPEEPEPCSDPKPLEAKAVEPVACEPETGWKKGPLPPNTWGWGGVVPVGMTSGFYFADFQGDKVEACPSGKVYKATEVLMYNNTLGLPPNKMAEGKEHHTRQS